MRWFILTMILLSETADGQQAQVSSHSEQFEKLVRPLLAEHCFRCHGATKQWAGLRLDSREAILRGGDSGPAAVSENAHGSLLIQAVRQSDTDLRMPQGGQLTEPQIRILEEWINRGMEFPTDAAGRATVRNPGHWSFQEFSAPVPPTVADDLLHRATAAENEPTGTDIDRFILKSLREAGLEPAPVASKETLIRRVTFDLTGLPPTPEEIDAFLADDSHNAWARLVDRLLASPSYGEHWGRHWLDVARYADSNGLDENIAHGNAWRYRDYVVKSLNDDKPFDRFIHEQLAGDLLPAENPEHRNELLTATGFLSIGPKVLAEVNQAKMRMDIVDEQIETVGRVFLGMTFGCARCHDHKFDPIQQEDYYGLAGIFRSTRTMDSYTKVAKWHEHPLQTTERQQLEADYQKQLSEKRHQIEELLNTVPATAVAVGMNETETSEREARLSEDQRSMLARIRDELSTLEKSPPELPSCMGVTEDETGDTVLLIRGDPARHGERIVRHTPPVIRGTTPPEFSSSQSGRRELALWLTSADHPMTSRVLVNRIWRWHFGEGLVRTPDNFGIQGEPATHPELLNWLAKWFIRNGWSVKSLHRLILNSQVYRQQSTAGAEAVARDPENRLWSQFRLRRLLAEEFRDSLLFVSGQLDQTTGGSLLKVKNRGYLFDHTSIDTTDYHSNRRSLYLPVIRNNLYDVFQVLDFPDPAIPTGNRATTTVAPQALLMMNSDLVQNSAAKFADRLRTESPSLQDRHTRLYRLAFGRYPTPEDRSADFEFLTEAGENPSSADPNPNSSADPWAILCHTVFASSEFNYVR